MEVPKIQLSDAESQLISNASIILTKNKALEKIGQLLAAAQVMMQDEVKAKGWQQLPVFSRPPKISKGENYKGLPWLILDYPRVFTAEGICAVRTLFLWGHFFSSTLHLWGTYLHLLHKEEAFADLQDHFLTVSDDPWQYHKEHFTPMNQISREEWLAMTGSGKHVRLAFFWPLSVTGEAPERLYNNWRRLAAVLSFPGGETGPSPGSPTALPGL